jgi:hypothetical protein
LTLWWGLIAALLALSACSAPEATQTAGDPAEQAPAEQAPAEQAPAESPAQAEQASPTQQATPAQPGTPEEGEDSAAAPDRPSAPAPIDGDFRVDPASAVAATGNPQLIEFFAFW